MKIEIPHTHSKAEAKSRIQQLLSGLKEKYSDKLNNIEETWTDDKGEFSLGMGPFSSKGSIDVKDTSVEINLDIPLFASLYKNQIRSLIEEQAKKILQ